MTVYNSSLHTIGNGGRYDYRFSSLLSLIQSINKNTLFTRHEMDENAYIVASFWNLLKKLIYLSKSQQLLFK